MLFVWAALLTDSCVCLSVCLCVVQVFAQGYYPREQAFRVTNERPTEISIALERVPVRVGMTETVQPSNAPSDESLFLNDDMFLEFAVKKTSCIQY